MSRIIVFGATGAMGMPLLRILAEDPNNQIYATSRQRRESGRIRQSVNRILFERPLEKRCEK